MSIYKKAKEVMAGYSNLIAAPDHSFALRVYNTPYEHYKARLEAIKFSGLEHVLDAGCGFGQWTIPMAKLNSNVSACDISGERLIVANKICSEMGVGNVQFKNGPLERLPYEDNSFDGLLCYSVIHTTSWHNSIIEFSRVLKPDGKLYFTANGLGWYLHCWKNEPYKQEIFDPRLKVAFTFLNTIMYEKGFPLISQDGNLIIEQAEITQELKKVGFIIIDSGAEGTINIANKKNITSNFKGKYEGHLGVYEILAQKKRD